jgi:adenosylmethionine-8-amino-7-oxononanoate aminotransferase
MRLAKGCNVHLILDEVATGFGRTGAMFACEHAGVSPDFLCLSKGITSGYLPLAATLTTDKVYRAFYANFKRGKTFYHGHTYTANPLSCAAALASLKVFARENTLRRCATLAKIFRQGLAEFRGLPLAGDIRQIGLIGAIELVRNKKTKAAFPAQRRIGLAVYKMGLQKGLVLRPLGNIIYLFLPLCVKREELKYILQNTYSIIKSLRRR